MFRGSIACWIAMSALTSSVAAAQPTPKPESAIGREFREAAVEAAKQNDWQTCVDKAAQSFAADRLPKAAGLLGICEYEVKLFRDAAEHLDYALRYDTDEARKADYRAKLNEAKRKIGTIQVKTSVDACQITIDAKVVGDSPVTIYVNPGEYAVGASKRGYKTATQTVKLQASYDTDVNLTLEIDESVPPPSSGFPLWPGIVVGSVGIATLGVGAGLLGAATGSEPEPRLGPGGLNCRATGRVGECKTLEEDLDSYASMGNAGIGMMIGGAVATTAGLTLVIVSVASGEPTEKTAKLTPVVGPTDAGFLFQTNF